MWEDGELSWLLAAASFDNEEQELGKALENEGVYMGKKLTTNTAVPGRLCRDKSYAEFYKDVLEADEKILKWLRIDVKCLLMKIHSKCWQKTTRVA